MSNSSKKGLSQAGMTMIEYLVLGVLVIALVTTIFKTISSAMQEKVKTLETKMNEPI